MKSRFLGAGRGTFPDALRLELSQKARSGASIRFCFNKNVWRRASVLRKWTVSLFALGFCITYDVSSDRVFIRVLKELDPWWKPLLCALSFLPLHLKVGILWIAELALLIYPQPFKEPFLSEFDIVHERDDVLARTGADTLDQSLVMDQRLVFNPKAIAGFVEHGKVDPKTVQGILRHSDIRTTMNLYTQDDRDEKEAAQGAFPSAVGLRSRLVQ